jgi:transposase
MEVLFPRCAGIDVHKRTVVACRTVLTDDGEWLRETRTYGTTTEDLLRLSDWLAAGGCTHVGLESTGEFWKPVFNILEGNFTVWLLNAQRVRAIPGRKTDVRDAEWIAELLRHGLVQPRFIPPRRQREPRELTRQRTKLRARPGDAGQPRAEGARAHEPEAHRRGQQRRGGLGAGDPRRPARRGGGRVPARRPGEGQTAQKRDELERALRGRLQPHHRFLLTELLAPIDGLDETIARFDAEIARLCAVNEEERVVERLDTIPGIGRAMAELLVAEVGVDMDRFPTPGHLAAWAGVAPGNNESAGRQRSGRTRKGNAWLKTALVQAAHGAARMKGTALAAKYQRVAARRGAKRAIMAVAHRLLIIAYHVIARREPYHELGGPTTWMRRRPVALVERLSTDGCDSSVDVTVHREGQRTSPPHMRAPRRGALRRRFAESGSTRIAREQ